MKGYLDRKHDEKYPSCCVSNPCIIISSTVVVLQQLTDWMHPLVNEQIMNAPSQH